MTQEKHEAKDTNEGKETAKHSGLESSGTSEGTKLLGAVSVKKEEHRRSGKVKISRKAWDAVKGKARKANEYFDQLLRLKAEFENYRKRVNKEREEFAKFATEELISDLLAVIDNLEHAISASEKTKDFKALLDGVELTRKEALRILGQWGLEEVKAAGEKFDPDKHEAIMHVESNEEEGRIVEQMRKGYSLKGKLIRPSMVKVSRRVGDGKENKQGNRD